MSHAMIRDGCTLGVRECWPRRVIHDGKEFYAEPLSFWGVAIAKARTLLHIGSQMMLGGRVRTKIGSFFAMASLSEAFTCPASNQAARATMPLGFAARPLDSLA
jgi:hypothetical protein